MALIYLMTLPLGMSFSNLHHIFNASGHQRQLWESTLAASLLHLFVRKVLYAVLQILKVAISLNWIDKLRSCKSSKEESRLLLLNPLLVSVRLPLQVF